MPLSVGASVFLVALIRTLVMGGVVGVAGAWPAEGPSQLKHKYFNINTTPYTSPTSTITATDSQIFIIKR